MIPPMSLRTVGDLRALVAALDTAEVSNDIPIATRSSGSQWDNGFDEVELEAFVTHGDRSMGTVTSLVSDDNLKGFQGPSKTFTALKLD